MKMKTRFLYLFIYLLAFQRSVEKKLSLYLNDGHWFVSLYNDFGDAQAVELLTSQSVEMTEGCPNGCHGHGECVLGRCQCQSGYGGDDCSQGNSALSILCRSRRSVSHNLCTWV
jgi:hypothetical protein